MRVCLGRTRNKVQARRLPSQLLWSLHIAQRALDFIWRLQSVQWNLTRLTAAAHEMAAHSISWRCGYGGRRLLQRASRSHHLLVLELLAH